MFHFGVGDRVTYKPFCGEDRTVTVTNKVPINCQPGFDGVMDNGTTVWGYEHQIVRVMVTPLVVFG